MSYRWRLLAPLMIAACLASPGPAQGAAPPKPASTIAAAALVEPAELAHELGSTSGPRPLLVHVGFRSLYVQGHIPGSVYAGPTSQDAGLQLLREKLAKTPKDQSIVIYCGCCPWTRCPNVAAAYDQLRTLGFTHVRVLHVDQDFGANWADKGYPVATGE
ncbi:MAG: rhodanese-like domain-containing protein [Proteobacteria bacterium]|nr:rhodanese-like domain-containing protein [Pseudomonadota bacterium]